MTKPTVTRQNEQSVIVEMPNTSGMPETYSVFYPEPGCSDPWVKVSRGDGKWAQLNGRVHHRQIQRVLSTIQAAEVA